MPYITCECGKNYHDSKVCCPDCGQVSDWYMTDDDYINDGFFEDLNIDNSDED